MKHISQGPGECKLAIIAMLAGVSLKECRALACKATGMVTWELVSYESFWKGIDALLPLIEKRHVKVLLAKDLVPIVRRGAASFGGIKKYLPIEPLPLQGKGELFVAYWYGNHSVAYEDGIIYDPTMPQKYPFDEWMRRHKEKIEYFIL